MQKNTVVKVRGTQEFMNKQIPVVLGGFGENCKVMLAKTIAEIHDVEVKYINKLINNNINRFRKDVDLIDLKTGSSKELVLELGFTNAQYGNANNIYLLSERGYAKLIKIMDTDLAWEIHDKLIDEYFKLREAVKQQPKPQVDIKSKEIEARLINAKVRQANMYLKIASAVNIPTYQQVMYSKATEALNGKALLPLPKAERETYSAAEIGERLGISSNKVGSLANKNNLKTEEYGEWVWDKSQHSNKQVRTFRYYENVIPVLKDILERKSA